MEEVKKSTEGYEVSEEEVTRIKRETAEELRPHFVFNMMNVIRYLIRTDPDKAYTAIYDLAKYMQGNLDKVVSGGDILLQEELTHARAYLNLEQVQRRKLSVKWNVQETDGYVPRGSIIEALTALLKQDPESGRQERTLSVEYIPGEKKIKVFIAETGMEAEIFVDRRDDRIRV